MSAPADIVANPWPVVMDVLATPVGASTIAGLATAFAVLSLGVFARCPAASGMLWTWRKLTQGTVARMSDKVAAALERPLRLVPIALATLAAARVAGLEDGSAAFVERFAATLFTVAIFWALRNLVDPVLFAAGPLTRTLTPAMQDWLSQGLKALAMFLGGATILEMWGVPVGPILAGFGLFGVAVALGAQDLFKNLIAGLSILMERRFAHGDWVKVEGLVEGTVERIGFRSTTVRRFDKSPVYVPNSSLADNAVTNFSRMTHRRIYWKIGLEYGATSEQLRTVCQKLYDSILADENYAHPPEVSTFVFVDSFNASSIDVMLYCFTKTTRWGEWLAIKQDLAIRIKEIVEEAGAAFAFPSQTTYLVDMATQQPALEPEASSAAKAKAAAKPKTRRTATKRKTDADENAQAASERPVRTRKKRIERSAASTGSAS